LFFPETRGKGLANAITGEAQTGIIVLPSMGTTMMTIATLAAG